MIFVGEILFRHECVHRGNESHDQSSDLRRRLLLRVQLGKYFVPQIAFQKQSLVSRVCGKQLLDVRARNKPDDLQSARCPDPFIKRNVFGVFCQFPVGIAPAENVADVADHEVNFIALPHNPDRHFTELIRCERIHRWTPH